MPGVGVRKRAERWPRRKVIYGCEAEGMQASAYLTRWVLLETRFGNLYLHVFHRSDADVIHDHPWDFISLILWRGYIEETRTPFFHPRFHIFEQRRKWPGMILIRKAEHQHRVILVDEKPAVSLVWTGKRRRTWGFISKEGGWTAFYDFFKQKGC